jgi:DNA-binding SARP family transcriptional activator
MLRLELLGTPNLTVNGRVVKLGVKHISMLAYLALEGRTSRRVLGNILWAEAPNALNNISVARNLLVKALGKNALEVDADSLALSPGFSCDVLEFRTGIKTNDASVWDVWRGAFLTGLRLQDWEMGLGAEFEDWLFATRESLIFERREFAASLGLQQLRLNNFEAAIMFLEVAQRPDGDPLEDACRHLILAYGATHKPDQALLAYNNLSKVLNQELGVQPSNRTKTALELARSAQADSCKVALQLELGVKITPVPERSEAPLVGRETELQAILDFLDTGRVVVIHGEPGAGKSQYLVVRVQPRKPELRHS